MSDQFLGEIRPFAGNFAPYGWMLCQGQTLPIQQYAALFSLLGTNYGGNGTTNFQLPNIAGVTLYNQGAAPGLSSYVPGETGGAESVAIVTSDMPSHNHQFVTDNAPLAVERSSDTSVPAAGISFLANGFTKSAAAGNGPTNGFVTTAANPATMAPTMLSPIGGGQPHENRAPFLTISYCIALQGDFPARP